MESIQPFRRQEEASFFIGTLSVHPSPPPVNLELVDLKGGESAICYIQYLQLGMPPGSVLDMFHGLNPIVHLIK